MKRTKTVCAWAFLALCSCRATSEQEHPEQANAGAAQLIFKDSTGHVITEEELSKATGQANYEVITDQPINPAAQTLHNEARELGKAGKYDEAIAKLEQATKIQPGWPYPVYDLAYTYLLKGDFDHALKFYKETDQLAPKGFFTAKTALYTLEGEKSGQFPKGLYMTYMQIEWTDNANEKREIAKAITAKVPAFAPAWKELAVLSDDKSEKLKFIELGLSKNLDASTKGILLVNKAILLNESGKKEEATQLLTNLIFNQATTAGNIALAKFTLRSIAQIN
jgi:tetratricopeptide (TPR) repeat protein